MDDFTQIFGPVDGAGLSALHEHHQRPPALKRRLCQETEPQLIFRSDLHDSAFSAANDPWYGDKLYREGRLPLRVRLSRISRQLPISPDSRKKMVQRAKQSGSPCFFTRLDEEGFEMEITDVLVEPMLVYVYSTKGHDTAVDLIKHIAGVCGIVMPDAKAYLISLVRASMK